MNEAIGLLETFGLTPAMVAIDSMLKASAARVLQVELNDLYGVCVKVAGSVADVQTAIQNGRQIAAQMQGRPVTTVLTQTTAAAMPGILSQNEFNPLIQQDVVFNSNTSNETPQEKTREGVPNSSAMNQQNSPALGFIETQGFTAVFEAIDTACKAANVQVVGKEKLGGGFVTVVLQGELSDVKAAVAAGKEKVEGLGKMIAAHVIARPTEAVLKLLPRL